MAKLNGKVAVVTGSSKGIGASIARRFATEGASVVANYASSREGAERVVTVIARQNGKAIAIQAHIANETDIRHLFSEAKKAFDRVDIRVNHAGIHEISAIENVTPEHFHKMFNLNVLGLILAWQEAVKHFGSAGGNIINIRSVASKAALATTSVYSATKAVGIAGSGFRKQFESQTPLGRIGQPEDVAPVAVFLASQDSGWITGETVYAFGEDR